MYVFRFDEVALKQIALSIVLIDLDVFLMVDYFLLATFTQRMLDHV